MKISNEWGVPNQFLIYEEGRGALGNFIQRETFQSYKTIIAVITTWADGEKDVVLDRDNWDCSNTTDKYRNKFLRLDKKETLANIKDGTIKLDNLNKKVDK